MIGVEFVVCGFPCMDGLNTVGYFLPLCISNTA